MIFCEIRDAHGEVESAGFVDTVAEAKRWFDEHRVAFALAVPKSDGFRYRVGSNIHYLHAQA